MKSIIPKTMFYSLVEEQVSNGYIIPSILQEIIIAHRKVYKIDIMLE